MITQIISPIGNPPSINDPANFEQRADEVLTIGLPRLVVELNEFKDEVNLTTTQINADLIEAADIVNQVNAAGAIQTANAAQQASLAQASAEVASTSALIAAGAANYKGEYLAGTTYLQGQSVSYLGRRFVAKKTNLGITPVDGVDWLGLAEVSDAVNQSIVYSLIFGA